VEDAAGVRAGARREHLGHERARHRPLAAHAERDEEAERGEVPPLLRERRQAGEQRVEQDRERQRALAADPVAQHPERDPAERPA
jgi:hypothetical protein